MLLKIQLLLLGSVFLTTIECRRVRVRPLPQEEDDEQVHYYAAEPQDTQEQGVVYISSADQYNGLYGQQASSRSAQHDNYIPSRSTPSPIKSIGKTKQAPKEPPVQTIRNYNKVNDDGSFTFGYEAADGSFKEETRGTDCVVRGKYGYVDPDGNKREFTYVSGNPCDPNAPKEEDERDEEREEEKPESGPANYPTRPIRPIRPTVTVAPKPAVTLFQTNYAQGQEEEEPEPEQVLKQQPQHIRARPVYISRPHYEPEPIYQRPRLVVPSSTPASVLYKQSVSPINITPRPVTASSTQQPATTYRPQLLHVAVTPRPALLYTTKQASPRPTSTSTSLRAGGSIDFDAEFQKFQQENNIVAPTPSSIASPGGGGGKKVQKPGGQIYSSELVYDPSSGQYNTQLYQTLPQTEGDFSLNHRIQPYVHQAHHNQGPLYRQVRPTNDQQIYQQQQAELQFQNSAQLYAQQQKARQQQQTSPQQFYYVQPQGFHNQPQGFQAGQIDAFLRGHNIQF